ncbi:MAG: IclR family transcriptional regulator [Chloroflexi bacterium]|nr:IclR family transcriptional regulator [Chloroflexota bacterium]
MTGDLASGPKLSGTVRKAFQILDQLSSNQAELAPREVAISTGLDRTTVYRLLETMTQIGVVARDQQTRRYRLGLRTLDYANATLDGLEVRHVALSHLIDLERELVLEPDEVERGIFVGVLDGPEIVLVEMGGTRSVFGRTAGRGRFPAYASAAGRCILAYLPPVERADLLKDVEFASRTPRTLTTLADVESRLKRIRGVGYDLSDREVFPDLLAIAVPVRGRSGAALASIGVCAPASSTTIEELVGRFAAKLIVAAQRTSMALRHRD